MWNIENANKTFFFISGFNLFGYFTIHSWWPHDTAYPWLRAGHLCSGKLEAIDFLPIMY
jgi:hypothetical protein